MIARANSLNRSRSSSSPAASDRYNSFSSSDDPISAPTSNNNGRGCLSSLDNETYGEVIILGSLLFFGISFSCQKKAMINGMGPLTYNAGRYVFSTLFLGLYLFLTKTSPTHSTGIVAERDLENRGLLPVAAKDISMKDTIKQLLFWGVWLGIANFGGSTTQQIGLVTVTAGKTGFITGMYVIFVPLVEYFFPYFHMKMHWSSLAAAILSLLGLYLLSGCAEQEKCFGGAIKEGEVIIFISMLFWVASIMLSDIASKQLDGVWITFFEFSFTTVLTIAIALYFEPQEWVFPFVNAQQNWDMMLIVGFTEAVAFALSTVGQTFSSPSRAALLFSLEAVVCAVIAFFVLGERLTPIEIVGGFLMFLAALGTSIIAVEDEVEEENHRLEEEEEASQPILVGHTGFGSLELTKKSSSH
jgi:drug/metabolite transporter (DMT)-like permease